MIIFVAKKRYPFQPHLNPLSSLPFIRRIATFSFFNIQSNLHTTATLGTEGSGRCKEVFTRVNVRIFRPPGRKKVAVVERWPLGEVGLY